MIRFIPAHLKIAQVQSSIIVNLAKSEPGAAFPFLNLRMTGTLVLTVRGTKCSQAERRRLRERYSLTYIFDLMLDKLT